MLQFLRTYIGRMISFNVMKGLHRYFLLTIMLMLSFFFSMSASVPEKPTQIRFVWDYANVIDDDQEKLIEDSIEHFSRTTSNQIVVMTVTDKMLEGFTTAEFGVQVCNEWGVGQRDLNNGVVIVIKPKTKNGDGEAHITTGYGAEGPLPDLLCSNIVNKEMIPHFKENDYASGVWAALVIIMPALQGEFNMDNYSKSALMDNNNTSTAKNDDNTSEDKFPEWLLYLIGFICFLVFGKISDAITKERRKQRFMEWFGVYEPESPEVSAEIPFNGDLQLCFAYLAAIDPEQAEVKNKVAAFIVRMINNGDIELLEDYDNAVKLITVPAYESPSSDNESYENVYHSLLSILWANSDEENIVYLDNVEMNPFKSYKYNFFSDGRDDYKRLEEYFTITSGCPSISPSKITPQEARSVMGLKKFLEEASIDYEQSTMINGIPSTEYLVYESLFGIMIHSNLNFLDAANSFSQIWLERFIEKQKENSSSYGDGGSSSGGSGGGGFGGGSSGGGGGGGRW